MVQTVEKKPITGFTPGKRYDFLAAFFRVLENEGIEVQYETVFTEVKDDPGKWSLSIFQKATDIDTLNKMKHLTSESLKISLGTRGRGGFQIMFTGLERDFEAVRLNCINQRKDTPSATSPNSY